MLAPLLIRRRAVTRTLSSGNAAPLDDAPIQERDGKGYDGPRGPTGLPSTEWWTPRAVQAVVEELATAPPGMQAQVAAVLQPYVRNTLQDRLHDAAALRWQAQVLDLDALVREAMAVRRLRQLHAWMLEDEALALLLLQ